LLLLFGFLTAANFVSKEERLKSGLWPDDGLRLGLDLRGGIHWVVGVRLDEAIVRELEFVRKSIEEQLEGKARPTQFGRIMQELGIISITSRSPQSRGRIERLWGTFQDRLVSELRLAGAGSMSEANHFLKSFLPRYNRKFAVSAREPGSAYRRAPSGFKSKEIFCFKYSRVAGMDNVVRFGNQRLQIMPSNGRQSYARARVEVQERMDGELAVYYQGQCLATVPAPAEAPVLRTKNNKYVNPAPKAEAKELTRSLPGANTPKPVALGRYKPGPDHPWRRHY